MFKEVKKSIQWGEETLTLETGKVARQADGSVIAHLRRDLGHGQRDLLPGSRNPGRTFSRSRFTTTRKYYAAGKVPGGFFKREARPSEKGNADLAAHRPDRSGRSSRRASRTKCWSCARSCRTTSSTTRTSWRMIAASAALTLSGAALHGPDRRVPRGVFGRRIYPQPRGRGHAGPPDNNPDQRLDLIVAGTKGAVMMVESEAYELSEAEMLGGGELRPRADPARDRPHHRSGRGCRQGAVRLPAAGLHRSL